MSSREKLLFIQYEFKFGLYKKLSYISIQKKVYYIYFIYFTPKHKMLRPKLNSCVYHLKSLAPPPGTLLNRRYIWYTVG